MLAMQGVTDAKGQPILMVSYLNEGCVRLFELPSFEKRGVLPQVSSSTAACTLHVSALTLSQDLFVGCASSRRYCQDQLYDPTSK